VEFSPALEHPYRTLFSRAYGKEEIKLFILDLADGRTFQDPTTTPDHLRMEISLARAEENVKALKGDLGQLKNSCTD
jgi:hypothetical protein